MNYKVIRIVADKQFLVDNFTDEIKAIKCGEVVSGFSKYVMVVKDKTIVWESNPEYRPFTIKI